MAGLDIRDFFYHWPIHSDSRRRLGVRHPITDQKGVYLFLPRGLSSAPGHNETFVEKAVTAASKMLQLNVARFVDDLRITNKGEVAAHNDEALLNVQLECLKYNLEHMGIHIHTKEGKRRTIPPPLIIPHGVGGYPCTVQFSQAFNLDCNAGKISEGPRDEDCIYTSYIRFERNRKSVELDRK